MRKSLLAVAALMGAGIVLPQKAEAFQIRVDEDTNANLVFRQQIRGTYLDKRNNEDKADPQFTIPNAGIVISGQVSKMTRFWIEWAGAYPGRPNNFAMNLVESTIQLDFAPEFKVQAGVHRLPIWRPYLVSSYSYIVPTGYNYGHTRDLIRPIQHASDVGGSGFRHGGLQVWGLVAEGMVRYHLGMYDVVDKGARNRQEPMFVGRIQFTPTMLGFRAERGYGLSDTYLGRQNVLSIGLGFATQKGGNPAGAVAGVSRGSATASELGVDLFYEQKFGDTVPGFMVAYKDVRNFNGNSRADGKAFIVQGQLLYDQMVGFGKPAVAFRYSKSDVKRSWPVSPAQDTTTIGAYVNYYIKGQDAKVQLGVDRVNISNKDRTVGQRNYTDLVLQLQTQF